ncbi:hypothetical protein AAG747_08100 [Rapidithrix thailandica]|uniref:Lipoprotein n=1 Tax=Rapidithrix thailandica TaxID=413964 RepID=A0AAW9S2Q0_9BACT
MKSIKILIVGTVVLFSTCTQSKINQKALLANWDKQTEEAVESCDLLGLRKNALMGLQLIKEVHLREQIIQILSRQKAFGKAKYIYACETYDKRSPDPDYTAIIKLDSEDNIYVFEYDKRGEFFEHRILTKDSENYKNSLVLLDPWLWLSPFPCELGHDLIDFYTKIEMSN